MAEVSVISGRLTQAVQSIRAARRSLAGPRDPQEYSQKAILLLSEILDLLYQAREQLSWSEEKWVVAQARLNTLDEILSIFTSTVRTIEVYFQPGGVGGRQHRKSLLEQTFVPRLEQFKVMFILFMQPESRERSFTEEQLLIYIRKCRDLEPASSKLSSQCESDFQNITHPTSSKNFIALADMHNMRLKGTCQWIFDEEKYKSWLFGGYRTLYCIGPPGSGKTFLASSVIDNLQKSFTSPDVAIVFLFGHTEKDDDQAYSNNMLANILAQLVYRKRSASYATASLYQSEAFAKGNASPKAYQNAIRAEIDRFSKVFIIIDGLDASHDKDRILNRLQKFPEHAQLLITLRDARYAHKDGYISALTPRKDLETYVERRIRQDASLISLLEKFPREYLFKEAIVAQVADKSHGLFLLARMHMDLLSRCNDPPLLQQALLHLPDSLNDTYAESMKQLASQNLYASRCIYWTLYAHRPLTVTELKSAVFFEPQNGTAQREPKSFENILFIETAGLLTVDPTTGTVHLIHRTAKEYLTGATARVFFPTARKHIAETCLTVITSDEVVDDCYNTPGTTPRNSTGSLVSYAATYWGYHAHEASEEEHTTQVLIRAFLNKLCWRRPPGSDQDAKGEMKITDQLGLGKYCSDWTALHVLAYFGIMGKAKRLIEKGDDVNAQENRMGITPLHCAAHRGNEEMVELLLDHGAFINATSRDGNTPMHLAAEQGQRKIMKLLLSRRASSRMANRQGVTALQLSIGTSYDETAAPLLIKTRSDMDAQNMATGDTAMHVAVKLNRQRILQFLLEKGANRNILNEEGLTPLQLAAKIDNCMAISTLLENGAKVDARSTLGSQALHVAASEGNWVAFDLLLIGGADINAWSGDGESLLHDQARKATNTSIATHLLEHGASIECRTSQGYTPLQCAAMSGNKMMFFFLLDNGANVDVQTPKGESFLHITPPSNQDCLDILTTLLEFGLDVKNICSHGWTPLHQTVFIGTGAPDIEFDKTSEYIKLLLENGADVNSVAESPTGETPLHLAVVAATPRPSLVSFLIKNGASLNSITTEGKTPLHLASERGRGVIFQALLEAGTGLSVQTPTSVFDDTDDEQTPLEVNHKHTSEAFWLNGAESLRLSVIDDPRESRVATTIEIDSDSESDSQTDDEIGGSTLVGEEGSQSGSILSAQSISIIE